jgi:hypothetical protein
MTLIDRYLKAVRAHLPSGRQDDIVRELSEELYAQVGDREAEVGRPLTGEEQEAFLKKLGHPLLFAARYRQHQYLIGPAIFPVYWQALKIGIGLALAGALGLAVATVAGGAPVGRAIGLLAAFPFTTAILVFGWMTLVFAIIDANLSRVLARSNWKPSDLPATDGAPNRNWTLLAEIIFSTMFLLWWLAVPRHPFLMFGPGAAFLALGPVWQHVHLAIAAIWAISLVSLWAFLLRPDWAPFRAVGRVVNDTVGLVIAVVLYRANDIVTLAPGVAPTADLTHAIELLNRLLHLCLLIGAAGVAWQIVRGLYRMYLPASRTP